MRRVLVDGDLWRGRSLPRERGRLVASILMKKKKWIWLGILEIGTSGRRTDSSSGRRLDHENDC